MLLYACVCISDGTMTASKSSLNLEVNHFLCYVQDKFSEVLLPVDSITKQGLLGKGNEKPINKQPSLCSYISFRSIWCGPQRGNGVI